MTSQRDYLLKLLAILDCTASRSQSRALFRLFHEMRDEQTRWCARLIETTGLTISGKPFADELLKTAGLE